MKSSDATILPWNRVFGTMAGIWVAILLLKHGNPVIFESMIESPRGLRGVVFDMWPFSWAYLLTGALVLPGLMVVRWRTRAPAWILILPVVWLLWQVAAASHSVDPMLSLATLKHAGVVVLAFYLGLFMLSRIEAGRDFWPWVTVGLGVVLWVGIWQNFVGFERMRSLSREELLRLVYQAFGGTSIPPLLEHKIQSDRIFATLVYPNALAGVILLLLPPGLVSLWQRLSLGGQHAAILRWAGTGVLAAMGIACLVWSGSKAGWLIALGLLVGVLWKFLPGGGRMRLGVAGVLLAAGLAGFGIRYSSYLARGATSLGARLDYWTAAVTAFREHPWLGTGPGTFGVVYRELKPPEAEMARLAHNDYLEQASDSGMIGALSFLGWLAGSVVVLHRRLRARNDALVHAAWLGLAAWAVQSVVEFGFYIPALAWPAFCILGWLWGGAVDQAPASMADVRAAGKHSPQPKTA